MKIVFPEIGNEIAQAAVARFPGVEWCTAADLETAAEMVRRGEVDSMISGLDFSSRDVLIAYKNHLSLKSRYFSSCFVCVRRRADTGEVEHLVLADGGVNKAPNTEQFLTIIEDSARTFEAYFDEQPRIAVLSYSTYGSGGKNPDLERFHESIAVTRVAHPEWVIDGEMQLDAAVVPEVAAKKTLDGPLGGRANVLIVPDLNAGNILYKALERYGGFTVAGPIIQGFGRETGAGMAALTLADLSRGSTVADVVLTIGVIVKLLERM